ncbi:MAG: hypothetical protein ACRD21_01655 [Vicinamibacteria bacterium]
MSLLLRSLIVFGFAHFLPGLLAVKLLDLGRSREERLLIAAILGGPIAALFYLASLLSGVSALYWILAAAAALFAVVLRPRSRLRFEWPRSSVVVLAGVLALVLVPYLLTTGSLYRVDERGELLLDRALQRDALFHLGVARSLEASYPPRLLSVAGEPIGYHSGYHLQIALWSRHFGIDPADGLLRLGPIAYIVLYVLAAYLLARRLSGDERARLLSAALVLASGFGFAFFFRPSVDWWSLTFMDWTLVSIFLANPLLPALPLLFLGLALLHDWVERGSLRALAGGVFALAFLFEVKMFLGAQVLGALALALIGLRREKRVRTAFAALALASSPVVLQTLLAASGSNTAVGFRPLEIVRYSMEKLDWGAAVQALAEVGELRVPKGWLLALAAALLWFVGFLGLRLLALPWTLRSLSARSFLPSVLAWFGVVGFPLSLLLRIAPAEARGLSRLEALNDAPWFAVASGIVLWFPTAIVLSRFRPERAGLAVLLLALPATAQHFLYAASLEPDRIGRSRIEAALEAKRISSPKSIWLEPLDRARPSLLPYFSGRGVAYEPYVGYDYMFVGREDIDFRRHGIAQFWASTDPGYQAWLLDRFSIDFLWREDRLLPESAAGLLDPVFANEEVELLKVRPDEVEKALRLEIASPERIPIGGRGQPYFGSRWLGPGGESRRFLPPFERASLYLPLERGRPVSITLVLDAPHPKGEIAVEGQVLAVSADAESLRVSLGPRRSRGLQVLDVEWRSESPLPVSGIEIGRDTVEAR